MMVMAFESRPRGLRSGERPSSAIELVGETFFGALTTRITCGFIVVAVAVLALFKNVEPTLKAGLGGP